MEQHIEELKSLDFCADGAHKDRLRARLGEAFANEAPSELTDAELTYAAAARGIPQNKPFGPAPDIG
ncbi:MAG: hypothetical protein FWC23_00800 [Chitinispirillia bacterium]|nr:hypothetical protein [Chitinispirillia bacterium]MCL2267714.1 hypothetical protein [Chitinispirillia bacterium]